MSLGLKDTESNIEAGLGTFTYTVLHAGIYNFSVQSTVVPTSSLSIVINQNGSPIATSATPSAQQEAINLTASGVACSVNDVISFVLTSAAAIDSEGQNVKSLINIVAETYNSAE
jgi:hypothetical protein